MLLNNYYFFWNILWQDVIKKTQIKVEILCDKITYLLFIL